MAFTDVSICNLALLQVGVKARITTLNDTESTESRACNAQYSVSRDMLLSDPRRDWTFARKRSILVASANAARAGFDYIYDAPTSMLMPRRIWNGLRRYRPEDEIPFRVEPNDAGTGKVILVDLESTTTQPELWHTIVVSESMFPPWFGMALALDIAANLVLPEIVSADMQEKAGKRAEVMLLKAIWADVQVEKRDRPPKDTFTASRGQRVLETP